MRIKKYNFIDIFKFIMSICVIAIHTLPVFDSTNSILLSIYNSFIELAVPFFFVASGFLMANKFKDDFNSKDNINIVKKTCFYILKLYIIWNIVYLPVTINYFISSDYSFFESLVLFLRGFLFIGEQYNSWQLWYLLSTIYSLIYTYFLLKYKKSLKFIFCSGILFLFLSVFIYYFTLFDFSNYAIFNIFQKIVKAVFTNGRILFGFFYISLGIFLSKYNIKKSHSFYLFVITFILYVILNFIPDFLFKFCLLVLFRTLVVVGLFNFINNLKLKDSIVYIYFRKMSTIIYFIHMYVWMIYYTIVYNQKTFGIDCFIVTTIFSIVISFIYLVIFNNKKNK